MDGRVRVVKGRLAGRAALALVACCAFVALAGCAAGETSGLGEGPGATSDGAALREGAARLPFAIEGVASDAPVVEVADAAKEASLEGVWSFGGDYADIGSFPLDGDTVFGSHSDDADDVASYGAALVGKDGAEMLEQPSDDPLRYYEPQDGSGDAELAVWRSSLVGDTAQAFADDWRLQAWDAETGEVRTLGAARDVDAHATFQAYGDVVPTTNGEDVYFSTAMQDGDVWKAVVLSCGLSGSGIGVVARRRLSGCSGRRRLVRHRPGRRRRSRWAFPRWPFSARQGRRRCFPSLRRIPHGGCRACGRVGTGAPLPFRPTTPPPDRTSAYGTTPLPRLLRGCTCRLRRWSPR